MPAMTATATKARTQDLGDGTPADDVTARHARALRELALRVDWSGDQGARDAVLELIGDIE